MQPSPLPPSTNRFGVPKHILRVRAPNTWSRSSISLLVEVVLMTHFVCSSGFEPLTYGELFAGMRGLLESVVATGQFWMLDGVLLKNESGAAGVRVWLDDPGEGEGAVATS